MLKALFPISGRRASGRRSHRSGCRATDR
jgi:hypothetical protein